MAKILIVDDDKDILKFTDALLSQSGHDVKVALDPISAMDALNTRVFDLLITDANMPHYTGYELIKTIRAMPRTKDIAVAMLTGVREKSSIEKAIKVGVDDYIVKPIDAIVFMKKVEDLLLKKPPKKQLELQISGQHKHADAKLIVGCKILAVSEYGLKVSCTQQLQDGNLVGLQTSLFEIIGIESPAMRILSSERINDEYIFSIAFIGLNDSSSEKLKGWLQNENNKKALKIA